MTNENNHSGTIVHKKTIRLDKWLWAARFYKTRSIAHAMIDGGKVHYNNQRSKPSKIVDVGAIITLKQGSGASQTEKKVLILQLSEQRRDATFAQTLYEETEESLKKRTQLNTLNARPFSDHRPNKKERRDINTFKKTHFSASYSD